jgi:four helix bundle protein
MKIEDMDVFRMSHQMTLKIYKITEAYPDIERFSLISQMRRASSSICMNLMEGAHRISKNEYKHFVSISRGSCGEVKYQLLLSRDLEYIKEDTFKEMADAFERISMMLTKLYSSIK